MLTYWISMYLCNVVFQILSDWLCGLWECDGKSVKNQKQANALWVF